MNAKVTGATGFHYGSSQVNKQGRAVPTVGSVVGKLPTALPYEGTSVGKIDSAVGNLGGAVPYLPPFSSF